MSTTVQVRKWYGEVMLGVLVLLTLVAGLARWQLNPVAPRPADPATSAFSADSAARLLSELLGDERPHPVDSEAGKALRQRIVRTLETNGYRAEIQESTSCGKAQRVCARVHNVIAVLKGDGTGKSVLAMAHYDSVAASPGASDNGAGVAVLLESARMLKVQPSRKNDVILLFTDGEESGLLGAESFASQHPLAEKIAAVINVEARGSSGRSILFETGNSSAWLVGEYAKTSKQPVTNSLIASLYKLLPNDTDLSVFKARGVQGLNFAFGEQQGYYHTSLDNLRNLDHGSLQQHGDNVYDLLKTLSNAELPNSAATGSLVYTDLLGTVVVQWPAGWSPVLAALLLAGFAVAMVRLRKRSAYMVGAATRGLLGTLLSTVLGGAVAYALTYLLSLIHIPAWSAAVLPNRIFLWATVLLVTVAVFRRLARNADPLGLWIGGVGAWLLLGLIASIVLPGGSYLFLLPGLVMVLCALGACIPALGGGKPSPVLLAIPALASFVVMIPTVLLVEIMMGFNAIGVAVMGALLAMSATVILPFMQSQHAPKMHAVVTAALVLSAVGGAALSVRAPSYTAEQPQGLNLMYVQDQDGKAVLTAGNAANRPPQAVLRAMGDDVTLKQPFSWNKTRFFSAPVTSVNMPAARLTVLSDNAVAQGRRVVARIDAEAGVSVVQILLPKAAGLQRIETDGQQLDYAASSDDYLSFICRGDSCNGREIVLTLGESRQTNIIVAMTPGLPGSLAAVADSRAPLAVPRDNGDQSLVMSETLL